MKTFIITSIFITLFAFISFAQSRDDLINEAKKLVYRGDVQFNKSLYLQGRALFEREFSTEPDNNLTRYYIAYTDYKLAIYAMEKSKQNEFDRFVTSAIENCKILLNNNENDAETKALLSGIYGIKIAMDGSLGQTLGPMSGMLISQALGLAPNNPRVLILAGINKLNTPEFFGGSKTKALEYFSKSVNLFESENSVNNSGIDWGYIESLAWLGMTYSKIKDYKSAFDTFKKVLVIEPDYSWVKYGLLPAVEEKLNSSKNKK